MKPSKDCVYVKKNISSNSSHFNITNDIAIPEFKSTIKKILSCDENVSVRDISFDNNKVTILGQLNYNIIYYSPNYTIDCITHSAKFSHEMSLANIPDNSIFDASVSLEGSEYELLGDHRILLKHIASITLNHHQRIQFDVLSDVQDYDDIQLLKNTVTIPNYLGHVCEKLFFKEDVELDSKNPSIYQILQCTPSVQKISYKIVDDKILVSAILMCNVLYLTDNLNLPITSFAFEKNLSQIVSIPDLTDESILTCSIDISDFTLTAIENSDGEQNILGIEAIFDVHVNASSPKAISVVDDAYAFSSDVHLTKETISLNDILQCIDENFYLKNTLPLNSDSSNITVHNVNTRVLFSEYKVLNDELIIEGVVNVSTFLFDDSKQEKFSVLEQEYPFKHALDYKCSPDLELCTYTLSIDRIDYNLNIENNLEFRLNLHVVANILCNKTFTLTTDILTTPIDPASCKNRPNLIVYFANANDTLWSIAKKYSTTVDAIRNNNGITSDTLTPHQQILIL